jgi:glycosyltransferase involved in cell wall biosynthesis
VPGAPKVTVAVPSFNQGAFLDQALKSIFDQLVEVEVFVADAGSADGTLDVIRKWEPRLAGWRSYPDHGQAAAINESIARGSAPYVCWINSDDWLLPGMLSRLLDPLDRDPEVAMSYGRAWHFEEGTHRTRPVYTRPFSERWMAQLNIIAQPATLIRRSSWDAVGGVDESLAMAMDYDLWWKLFKRFGAPAYVPEYIAVNREHRGTKTATNRRLHYREAMSVVRKHHGRVPLKWYLAQPYAVWWRSLVGR